MPYARGVYKLVRGTVGALPMRFRRARILVVGCGDVALRVVQLGQKAPRRIWRALTSSPDRLADLRSSGMTPLRGNLDQPDTLRRLAGLGTHIVYCAPPSQQGVSDERMRALLRAVQQTQQRIQSVAYVSTSGVYGDCQGEWVTETRPVAPANARAVRRVDAERQIRYLASDGVRATVLRAPGIYALNRPNGSPATRLMKQVPVLRPEDDVFTNHIHADDLARACWLALWRGKTGRVFNANDDTAMLMGDYFDYSAQVLGLPAPPRISRNEAEHCFSALQMSFLSESRRLSNLRIKRELRMQWRYPTIKQGLSPGRPV
ncbi:SDR family oxidoreductase [Lampropedia puyangensis]|uniref:SDR family oxidoreductase n=2 Tax=Lampropedia puyangensis TaxID=1330072 RepID=A0A4S8F9C4_9BURK|nr:SDR family oxidoreductase [Lampropedia puyangensis]THU04178.1 SDR family oxidoreductase [Lampropedia puyangensis]